jgi:hypothetical protein
MHGKISLFPCFLFSLIYYLMLAKKTIKNQITLPKAVITHFQGVDYFDVTTDGTSIVLRPLQLSRADEVRAQLSQLGIEESDVAAALSWARKSE